MLHSTLAHHADLRVRVQEVQQLLAMCRMSILVFCIAMSSVAAVPTPQLWPALLKADLRQNRSGALANVTLCYDFAGGRNLNVIDNSAAPGGSVLYDNERANGSTYYYSRHPPGCKVIAMGVGLLRPDWLRGATYIGPGYGDTDCFTQGESPSNASVPFLTYCQSQADGLPRYWTFFDGARFDVDRWEPDATCSEAAFALPPTCFNKSLAPHAMACLMPREKGDLNPFCYQCANYSRAVAVHKGDPLQRSHVLVNGTCIGNGFTKFIHNDPIYRDVGLYRKPIVLQHLAAESGTSQHASSTRRPW